jgi:thiosulfate/3-mercaptopyruvate sulfurtransferase
MKGFLFVLIEIMLLKGLFISRIRCFSTHINDVAINSSKKQLKSLLPASDALLALQNEKNIKFVDGTWYLGNQRNPHEEFRNGRIQGAQFFDIEQLSDKSTELPHMLPTAAKFEEAISNMGISSQDHVIVYTQSQSFSAARVWWTFRVFGHDKISILQGGIDAWKQANGPIESGEIQPPSSKGKFTADYNRQLVADAQQVLSVVMTGSKQIVDARSKARFLGQAPEPRPGLAGGHIPGSLSLPFTEIVESSDSSRFKSLQDIKTAFQEAGLILGSDVIFTCGSGVTASILLFGLHLLGQDMKKLAVYDGSWSEWASRGDLPIHNPATADKDL